MALCCHIRHSRFGFNVLTMQPIPTMICLKKTKPLQHNIKTPAAAVKKPLTKANMTVMRAR